MSSNITGIKGIGEATKRRLDAAGITDIDSLAQAEPGDLTNVDISESKARRIIRRAQEKTVITQSGEEVAEEFANKSYTPTGLDVYDDALGGLEESAIVGVTGGSDTGKTQFCFKCMVSAVEATGLPAVYIETEGDNYRPSRLQALANDSDTQSNIYRIPIKGKDALEEQLNSYGRVRKMVGEGEVEGISIVVIDSFNARFRMTEEYENRGSFKARSNEIRAHLNAIESMKDELKCPVLMTLQVYGNPSGYGAPVHFWGGEFLSHMKSYMVKMSDSRGGMKKLEISGHPGNSEVEMHLHIKDDDIVAIKKD